MKKSNFIIKQPGLSERSVLMYSTITTSIIEIDEKMYSDIFEKEQYEKYADEVKELYDMAKAAQGAIDHIYLHWTAGHHDQTYEDYHINITGDGTIYASTDDLTTLLYHTWHRNSRAIGISMCCCVDAVAGPSGYDTDFGPEPPTSEQINAMSKVVAVLCKGVDLPIEPDTVMTHCEAAEEDAYGPSTTCERWDLWYLQDTPGDNKIKPGGDIIRGKAIWFQEEDAEVKEL